MQSPDPKSRRHVRPGHRPLPCWAVLLRMGLLRHDASVLRKGLPKWFWAMQSRPAVSIARWQLRTRQPWTIHLCWSRAWKVLLAMGLVVGFPLLFKLSHEKTLDADSFECL